jgi:site-specific DNA recombinase
MTKGTRTAVLYTRVSTTEQAEQGYSLAQQVEACRTWCEREGYEVLEEISDRGQSGATLQRLGMDRVRDLVAGGGVSVIVAQDADRITRDPIHRGFLDEEFERFGTRLVALDDWGDDSHEGELLRYMKGWVSKGERLKIAERTRRGLDRKVREGKVIRGNKAPYGFAYADDGNSLVIAPEMGVVRRIFHMVGAEGLSLGEVERQLNREGIPSPTGGKWRRQSLRYLVLNELYRPLSAGEVAASGLVTPEVVRDLDEEGVYGLWTWNRFQVKRWRELAVDGVYVDRVENKERPREEWTAVPVPLADAGLVGKLVEAARGRLAENKPRQPANLGRFWQLTGKISWCRVCGNGFSTHTVHEPRKIRYYYRCYTRYNIGLDACTNSRHLRADVLEELVWGAVLDVISNPDRLRRQWQEHINRQLRQLRGDPNKEARRLVERLQKLERRRSGYLDQEADGLMSRAELRTKLAAVDRQHQELRQALNETQDRQQSIKKLEFERDHNLHLVESLQGITYVTASPQDRHRIYKALRLRVEVDKEGQVRLSGIFDPDVHLHFVMRDPPIDPSEPLLKIPESTRVEVVTRTSAGPCTS